MAEPLTVSNIDGSPAEPAHKLAYIDSMRGIAILLVILVHHGQCFPSMPIVSAVTELGQMGVQLFFVASAFTLCMSSDRRLEEAKPVTNFFIRRFFRIAPLYYLAIAFYGAIDALTRLIHHSDKPSAYTFANVVSNMALVHGFVPQANNSVVPGGWSIGTEVAFYLIFPLLFLLFFRSLKGSIKGLAAGIAASLILDIGVQEAIAAATGHGIAINGFLYFNIINQMPVFLIGMMAYATIARPEGFGPNPIRDIIGLVLFAAIAFALIRLRYGWAAIFLPTVGATASVLLLNLLRRRAPRVGLFERIGRLSFSMYVFHFVFAWLVTRAIVRAFGSSPSVDVVLYVATLTMSVAGSMLVATASKRFIEDPFIDFGKRWIRARDRATAIAGMR